MGRVGDRFAARVVVGEHGREPIARRRTHAVEMREHAVAVAKEPQHRHHAVDRVVEGRGRRHVARREGLAQRQEVEQQLDQRAGVAADMTTVGKDLALQFVGEMPRYRFQQAFLARHAQRGHGERDDALQARQTIACGCGGAAQVAHVPGEAAQEATVELRLAVVQEERRLAQPGHDAARHDVGPPGDGIDRALQHDPFVDQSARIGPRDAGLGGAQVTQPAEAEQRLRPLLRRRHHLERRAAVAGHDLAGEGEAAGVDLARSRRIGGAQILRRDDQPVGAGGDEAPAHERMRVEACEHGAQAPARHEQREPGTVRDRPAGHGPALLPTCPEIRRHTPSPP